MSSLLTHISIGAISNVTLRDRNIDRNIISVAKLNLGLMHACVQPRRAKSVKNRRLDRSSYLQRQSNKVDVAGIVYRS